MLRHIQALDKWLCVHIFKWNGRRTPDRIMYAVSHFGYGYLYPVIIGAVLILDKKRNIALVQACIFAFFIELSGQTFFKRLFKRIRPFQALPDIKQLMTVPDAFSFPSGHAAGAFAMATLFHHFYPGIWAPSYGVALLIGVSRIYNGLHYPSDVMAGSALGFFSARLGLALSI